MSCGDNTRKVIRFPVLGTQCTFRSATLSSGMPPTRKACGSPLESRDGNPAAILRDKKMETEAAFFEPFLSHLGKERFYFITKSGKLFSHARPKENVALRKTDTEWDNAKCPITIIVTDEKSGRTFVAGPDKTSATDPKWFWFELGPYPKKKVYEPGPQPNVNESLRSVLRFARFLDEKHVLSAK
jgi:hypothetical protein